MRHFRSQHVTTASHSAVWAVWKDVSRWPEWDTELEAASLHGPFVTGAIGSLIPKRGPQSPFTLSEVTDEVSFTYVVRLPLARLEVGHYFTRDEATTFVHEVTFRGPLGVVFGRLLGRTYAAALPGVLARIARLAERAVAAGQ